MKLHRKGIKRWQKRRAESLKKNGFLPFEVRQLVYAPKGRAIVFGRSRWFIIARRQRVRELRMLLDRAEAENWTKTHPRRVWSDFILGKYEDSNWLLADGTPDAWKMFRAWREEATRRGWDTTPLPGSKRRSEVDPETGLVHRIDKGDVKAQKARRRARPRAGSSYYTGG